MFDNIRTWVDSDPSVRLLLTYLPLFGSVGIGMIAKVLRDRAKFWFLCGAPAVLAVFAYAVAPPVFRDGNLLGLTVYGMYWVALPFYYVGLVLNYSAQMRRRAADLAAQAAGKA